MCGIIGVISKKPVLHPIVKSLMRLEYRGYDSFGFAGFLQDDFLVKKAVGAITQVFNIDDYKAFEECNIMIAHTRWATHGGVSEVNAHPHISFDSSNCIAHNGVVTNFQDLLRGAKEVWNIVSQTDTEIAANILAEGISKKRDIIHGLSWAFSKLEGEFAIVAMLKSNSNILIGLRRKSPLIVAKMGEDIILASDELAFVEFGKQAEITYLDDNEAVICKGHELKFYRFEDDSFIEIKKDFVSKKISAEGSDLGEYSHYMIKEITEEPQVIKNIAASIEENMHGITEDLHQSQINIAGSGSAFYVSQIGQYFFGQLSARYAFTHPSDEMLNLKQFKRNDHLIAVSQSGETFDTLEVVRTAKLAGAYITSINNVRDSTSQRLANFPIFQNSGKEVCVLSTKSILSQVCCLFLLALELGYRNGEVKTDAYDVLTSEYKRLPDALEFVLRGQNELIKRIAYQNCNIEHWFFIGRGIYYPVAMESALKFKEVSYLHAEGMPAGFFKHGTISLIDDNFYTVAFIPSRFNERRLYEATLDNLYEIKARGGNIIGIGHTPITCFENGFFLDYVEVPDLNKYLNSCLQLCVGQLLAYHCAVALDRNIDRPRALAKSVTVR
ncbi:MAG: glutamine--fructose-6-phosphate transaminase (isomerizing) [Pegethrix bostrychoides GSE-TBD4-15B]|jgi:glucosamine--fructose-6-phosphate aminotransferase (isomerizing)|uniref:Glutamine--fructose-6-phosphate aminotransferase [isomerizing] n=1 Tax=Pegethrix bostrychoides GSE-TBD4-15B TaxID=2839662 RepID=A0A951P952_9CYAN|nr:glutamine--fructose-6-phosphate transaminase (isomerizing) [Pegethrix bostrychoides GSE-TBD4-15B]